MFPRNLNQHLINAKFAKLAFAKMFHKVSLISYPGEGNGTPLQLLLPGKSHGRRSLVGCSPWGRKELDTTETSLSLFTFMYWKGKWQPTPVFLPGVIGKVMSLLFNMLSRLVITFLSRSMHLLISWLQSPSAVILKPPKIV